MKTERDCHGHPIFKIGDFVCCNNAKTLDSDMSDPLWQAIGIVEKVIPGDTPFWTNYEYRFPARVFNARVTLSSRSFRKASRYEGMMAFWEPETENRIFDQNQRRIEAAKEKAAQSNVTLSDF